MAKEGGIGLKECKEDGLEMLLAEGRRVSSCNCLLERSSFNLIDNCYQILRDDFPYRYVITIRQGNLWLIPWSYYKFIIMQDHGSISKLRECFNESTFFSTEVSSPSRSQLINQDSLRLAKIPSKFTDDPQIYLRKIKIKKKEANEKCLEALRNTVKAKVGLERVQRDAAVSRYDFMRLYNIKKFKLDEQVLLSSYRADHEFNIRLSLERTKRSRILNEFSLSARKEQQIRVIEHLFETNKQNKSVFRETLRASQEKAKQYAEESAQRVKKERLNFQIRKKNLTELNTTKQKLNYLSKINEEMQAIKEFQQMVEVAEQDPEYLQQLERKDLTERKKEKEGQRKSTRFSSTYAGGFY